MKNKLTRRELITFGAGAAALGLWTGCEKAAAPAPATGGVPARANALNEEYVWLTANASLPLFVAHDHQALRQAGEELGVRVTIAGPNNLDIPALIAAFEQTIARKPTGIMVLGWDPSALVPVINRALDAGIPTICVDADVPDSRRIAFVGTDWHDLGKRQAEAMVQALHGRKGKVALLGLIDQVIDQQAFRGFREVAERAGLTVQDPQHDKGNAAEAARVAAGLIQGTPDLVGLAGFDSESGPGLGQAIKEARKIGQIIGTCVDAEEPHLRLLKEGVLAACVGQKRELFTYLGVKCLFEIVHSKLRFTADDKRAGLWPVPVHYSTGTYTVTRETVDLFLKG
jgi:ribose transport system substrate-binding protein